MIAMLLILMACLAAWAHVLHMLDSASGRLADALNGDLSQAGGWRPLSSPDGRRAAMSRPLIRA